MVHSYQEYLAEPKALTLEEMQEIHGEIAGEIGSDADGMELYDELMAVAVRYASIRAGMAAFEPGRKDGKGFPAYILS